jgi:hypothetical protein
MMDNVVITESESDAAFVRSLIGRGSDKMRYIPAGSWSSADSLARSYLTDPKTKVAIVVDADSSDPNQVEERKRFLRRSLGQIADKTRWRVIVIAPEVERLLFDDRHILEELVQDKVSDTDFVEGQYNPKKVLQRIAAIPTSELFERLATINLAPIQDTPDINALRQFFEIRLRKAAA